MHILINGNLGYIGPVVVDHFRKSMPESIITGFDTGFFAGCLFDATIFPERKLNTQYYGDIRKFQPADLYANVNSVVQLAAISNDPMGKEYESATFEVNADAVYVSAMQAKKAGVSHFVFASSCSVYGAGGDKSRNETDELNPLTAYAQSKIKAEERLQDLADDNFIITCLRFATACGWSPRLRLDLVLNDFISNAVLNKKIQIISDGTPWRPLIHVKDMARAIDWACQRKLGDGGSFLIVNTGSDDWNYQVKDLAYTVSRMIDNVEVEINVNASPDNRSYKVDFSKFASLAKGYLPEQNLQSTITEMVEMFDYYQYSQYNKNLEQFVRLIVLSDLQKKNKLDLNLYWKS
jgi:nucleoside-diphosphate-sugar epimerase